MVNMDGLSPGDASIFEHLVEASPSALVLVAADGKITFLNARAEELFGYARASLLGHDVELLVPKRLRPMHEHLREAFQAQPTARRMGAGRDLFAVRADGSEVPVEIGLTPIATAQGPCVLASIIDITERKRAEELFRRVVEASPSGMVVVDSAGTITLVNTEMERLFGFEREELIGRPLEMLVPERYRQAHPSLRGSFLAEPQTRAMGAGRELFAVRRDGSEVPVEIALNPIVTPAGAFTLASILDLTSRNRAEVVHQRMAALVESADDSILVKDLEGIVQSWNPAASRLLGYRADEILGRSVTMLIPAERQEEESALLESIRDGESVVGLETVRLRKDGSLVDVSLTLSPIRDRHGAAVGASTIMRDISRLKRQEEELRRSNAELEQFAYIASHDLQEPLRMVAAYTQLLGERYRGRFDEKADKYLHYAVDGAKSMQRLVADLLSYSRVGTQGRPLAPASLGKIVHSVVTMLRPVLRDTGAVVEVGPVPQVLGDEPQLEQLFQNLIGNAVKFRSSSAPVVRISAERRGGMCQITVTDNGIGIEMAYAERVFQMFQRLHERGRYEGSGIGLAIAKRIVERHGGRIWLESQPGVGTSIHFTLPTVEPGVPE